MRLGCWASGNGSSASVDVYLTNGVVLADRNDPIGLVDGRILSGWSYVQNPISGAAWSAADVDAMQWGLRYAGGNRDANISLLDVQPVVPPPGWGAPALSWDTGRGVSNSADWAEYPVLAIGPGGAPVVASEEGTAWVYLRRWNGSVWEELGGSASSAGVGAALDTARQPDVAIDPAGEPVVAYVARPSSDIYNEIHVERWSAGAWRTYGATSAATSSPGNALGVSLALEPDTGNPVIAWSDNAPGVQSIYVERDRPGAF